MTDVVRLNANFSELATIGQESCSLASLVAQQSGCIELIVYGLSEGTTCISEESNTARLVGIEALLPGVHADQC